MAGPGLDRRARMDRPRPFEDLPRLFNPPRDYVATANNPVLAPGGAPFLSVDSDSDIGRPESRR